MLPWGQISFWGATVITNLLRVIPVLGPDLVTWVWGGYRVGGPTLRRFFILHFLLPFVIAILAGAHLVVLHLTGSRDPVGADSNTDKIPFHPYLSWKDYVGFRCWLLALGVLSLSAPWALGEADNFIEANPLMTPAHIKPEWYFLFAYAILRRVPNKLGGVVALALRVAILPLLVLCTPSHRGHKWSTARKAGLVAWAVSWAILTWGGGCLVETPYIEISILARVCYFRLWAFLVAL